MTLRTPQNYDFVKMPVLRNHSAQHELTKVARRAVPLR